MSDLRSLIAQHIQRDGAAAIARELDVSREALLGYCAGTSRKATREFIETRAKRLYREPASAGQ